VLACDNPTNAGAIVRSCEAVNATACLFVDGYAHAFHPKTVRASAGSILRQRALQISASTNLRALLPRHRFIGASAHAETSLYDATLSDDENICIVMGNESKGIVQTDLKLDQELRIPTNDSVESLNVACAASILLFELKRQQTRKPSQ
jgi:tRNA G18 (ribose-2'-O)-methylase SpoU